MHERAEFSFDRPFVVSRPGGFICNGRRYASGEPFDWREQGLSESEIWDLWVLCQVDTVPAASSSEAEPDPPPIDPVAAVGPVASDADGAVPIVTAIEPPMAVPAAPVASAAQGTLPLVARPSPNSPAKAVTRGVTKPPHQNQLARR